MNAKKVVFKVMNISLTILVVVLVIFAAFRLGSYAYDFGYRVYMEDAVSPEPGRDVVVQVDRNMSSSELGSMLEEKGLVRDGTLFMIQLKLSAYSDKIMPGIYTLNTSMTSREMMETMAPAEVEE